MKLLTEYQGWLAIFCVFLALVYTFILYRKDKAFENLESWKRFTMTVLRFVFVFFISFLLLSPLVKTIRRFVDKPIILFAQDNSESIVINSDSSYYKKEYPQAIQNFIDNLKNDYEVVNFSFGDKIENKMSFDYSSKHTNFSELFDEIQTVYSNRNVGALIVASDGIFNKGSNPVYQAEDFNFPVYTVSLGNDETTKDIAIVDALYNRIVFLGNRFPIRFEIHATELNGTQTDFVLYENNTPVYSKTLSFSSNDYSETVDVELEAKKTGIRHFKAVIKPEKGEINTKNNFKEIVIDVIDNKQKILVLSNSPHPDNGVIMQALKTNENFELEFSTISDFNKTIESYNLIILNQLPSKNNSASPILSTIFKNQIPVLFILGSQSDIVNFNNLKHGMSIQNYQQVTEETQAAVNEQFLPFEVDKDMQEFISRVPPLISPFGNYSANAISDILLYQKIKSVVTTKPLIYFGRNADSKFGVITGEGIWRWRMYDYVQHNDFRLFDDLINKIVHYLALRIKKEQLIVTNKNIFNENEAVIFNAEVYNESYEPITESDVNIEISDAENHKFPYIFNKSLKTYTLNAGIFPVGDYTYNAKVLVGNKEFAAKGNFTVAPVNIESAITKTDKQLLYQLSNTTKGKMYSPQNLDSLSQSIKNNKNIVAISYTENKLNEIINLKWVFFLLLALISAEWFLRKFYGSY